ncbi:multidrug resistance protein MdtH [Peptococcaceae bacterium CEB3]|nr:multidrug resistance protein MdtH [Peptococcaceae bacterium CEB3]
MFRDLLKPYRGLPKEVYIIFIARIVNALGCFVMPLLTLILTEKVGLSKEAAGLYISVAGFLYMPASMLGGKLADSFGRKNLIVICSFLGAILYIVCGLLGPSLIMVYVLMFAGAFMAMADPANVSLLADLTTPENRNGAYSLIYMGWNIGFAVGPVLGGMLFKDHLAWVFIGDAATALLALGLVVVFVKDTLHRTREEIGDEGRRWERREEGSIFSVLLKRPVLLYFALIIFGYNFTYAQWAFLLPMQSVRNFGAAGAQYFGLVAAFNGLIVMVFTPVVTRVTERIKNMRRIVWSGFFYAVGFGLLGVVNSLALTFLCAFIFTIGEIVLSISATPFLVNHTPASHRGRMNALIPTIMGLGYTLGPLGMGQMLRYVTMQTGWLLAGGLTLVCAFLMYGLEKYDERCQKKGYSGKAAQADRG